MDFRRKKRSQKTPIEPHACSTGLLQEVSCCTNHGKFCPAGVGGCGSDSDCAGDLICDKSAVGTDFGYADATYDICVPKCPAQDAWPATAANHSGYIPCEQDDGNPGQQERSCDITGSWEEPSECGVCPVVHYLSV